MKTNNHVLAEEYIQDSIKTLTGVCPPELQCVKLQRGILRMLAVIADELGELNASSKNEKL
jgi:hypothetical protein